MVLMGIRRHTISQLIPWWIRFSDILNLTICLFDQISDQTDRISIAQSDIQYSLGSNSIRLDITLIRYQISVIQKEKILNFASNLLKLEYYVILEHILCAVKE